MLLRSCVSRAPVILCFAVLGFARLISASQVVITITGTISSGSDTSGSGTNGLFAAPHTDLAGRSFTLTYTFDDTKGTTTVTGSPPYKSEFVSIIPNGTGNIVLEIGGVSYTYPPPAGPNAPDAYRTGGELASTAYFYSSVQDQINDSNAVALVYPAPGEILSPDVNWESPFTYSNLTDYGVYSAFVSVSTPAGYLAADVVLNATSITVSGPEATDPLAKLLGSHCDCSCPCAGEPITVATGNVFENVTDYQTAGPNRLGFARYYNSLARPDILATGLGSNWRSNYDRTIQTSSPTAVAVFRADGQVVAFTLNGGIWTTDTDVDIKLTQSGTTWTLTDHDDTVETYAIATRNFGGLAVTYGQLSSVQARNGYTETLNYNASNQLVSVADSYGRTLSFTYNNDLLQTVTTPDALVLTYSYSASGAQNLLISVAYSTTPPTSQTYLYENPVVPFALTGILDENGNRFTTWTYDGLSRGLKSQHGSSANLTTVTYNADGTVTATNAFGVADTYSFATLQGVPKAMQISRAATSTTTAVARTFAYDTNGYVNSATDWNGNLTTYVNDIHGDPTTINEAVATPVARSTYITYDPIWVHLPDTIVTPELTTSYVYDGNGNPLTKMLADTTTTTLPYTTQGQTRTSTYTWVNFLLASAQTPNGNLTRYGYDSTGALTSTTNALNQVTNITSHTGGGYPLTIVDPNNVTTTLTYNARLWLLTSTVSAASPPSFTTTWGYDPAGNLTSVTLPDNSKLTYGYDTAHRVISVTDLFSNSTAYTLDGLGDVTLTNLSNPKGTVTRTHSGVFDALGRVLQDIGGVGQTTSYTYDPNGNALTITDPDNNLTQQSFDALNRLSTVTYPSPGGIATMTYDQHDHVLTVTDPNSNVTSYIYDGFGDAIQQASPDTVTTVYIYDADSNLTQKTDVTGAITNNTYDALERVLTTTYPNDATENVSYTYDQTGHGFGIGHLTSLTDAVGRLSRGYDERGNMLTEIRTSGADTLRTTYSYDLASHIAAIGYPSAAVVAYTRDIMGRITRVSAKAPGRAMYSAVASAVTYTPFGPVAGLTFGNGIADTRGYDLDYRMTGLADTGTAIVQKLLYVYDPANNVLDIQDKVNAANSQVFRYDPLNRLTQASSGAGGYGNFKWTYDAVGNRLTQAHGGLTTYNYTPGTNQLASIIAGGATQTVGTTPTGNIDRFSPAMNSITALSYNQANRLATATAGTATAATYTYDAFGQRLVKTPLGASPILYQFDQSGNLLEEGYASATGPVDYIYLGAQPIATLAPGTGAFSYLHTDHLGTPQLATSSAQAVVWSAAGYQPFGTTGTVTGTITQNLRFPGQYFEAESAFYHNGFRNYMPNLGRYLESDPVGLTGGINTYSYVGGNPTGYIDKSGKFIWVLAGGVLGAAVNVGVTAWVNGGFSNLTAQQFWAAAGGGFVAGALGALAGPAGGTIAADWLGADSSAGLASIATSGILSAGASSVGQEVSNVIDPCHSGSLTAAAAFGLLGGGVSKALPTQTLNTISQARSFGPTTVSGLFGSANSAWFWGSSAASSAIGAAGNWEGPF